jgi:glycosyltransferase involved in cell wall biosynthesis
MKIRVDATTLLLESTGVKNYVHYWLASLTKAAIGRGDVVTSYPPGLQHPADIDHTRAANGLRTEIWRLALVHFANVRHNPALDLFVMGADVFHCSQHAARPPRWKKLTATLFDMSCWKTPQYHRTENVIATRRYAAGTLKRCDGIIAISAHARQDAAEILDIPKERIRVIYPGVADAFFDVSLDDADRVRAKFGLHAPYVLYVGCIEPRKNVTGLLQAWETIPASLRNEMNLVIAGPYGWNSDHIRTALSQSNSGIKPIGYVPEADLPGLFAGATAFTYPSFYEGFGLPIAQAMAAGVPVITSNRSCLPEVVADAGICVDPDCDGELSDALSRVLTDRDLRAELAQRGRTRARSFHWGIAAKQSLDFFHDLTGK